MINKETDKGSWLSLNANTIIMIIVSVLSATGFTWNATHDEKGVSESHVQTQIDTLKAQISRTFTKEAAEAAVVAEISHVTGRDAEFIRHALDGAEKSMEDKEIWDSLYKPFIDNYMKRFDGACGFVRRIGNKLEFMDCYGSPKKIYLGKVGGSTRQIHYYRNDDDNVVPVRYLNTFTHFE